MRHVDAMRVAVRDQLTLEEAQRQQAIARHDAAMARLHRKGWPQ